MTSSGGAPTTTRRPTARSARTDSSVVSSNESGYRLSTSGSPLSGLNSGTIFHCAAPLEVVARVLHPNDRNLLRASPFDHAADVRDRRVPLVRLAQDAGLHVDHQQRGVRTVLECRHGLPSLSLNSVRLSAGGGPVWARREAPQPGGR